MCYSIPGKVIEASGKIVSVDYFGDVRKAVNEGFSLKQDDFIYVQAGFVVQKIDSKKAEASLGTWKKLLEDLKKKDEENAPESKPNGFLEKLTAKKELSEQEIIGLLDYLGDEKELFAFANDLRRKELSNSCCVHGIIEFSNYCSRNCAYCGIRRGNKEVRRYRMTLKEIVEATDYACNNLGFKALVLQSGEDSWYSCRKMTEIITGIKKKCGAVIFLSIGERSVEEYKAFYDAGARGALMRFETSDSELYQKLRGSRLEDRLNLIKALNKIGFLVVTGALIGLPEQTKESIARDVLLTKRLTPEMYSFSPFLPHPKTPLAEARATTTNDFLKVLSAIRLCDKKARILVTTALETLDKEGRKKGLLAGGNSIMLNATPQKFKALYEIYPNKPQQEIKQQISRATALLHSLGRAPTDLGA